MPRKNSLLIPLPETAKNSESSSSGDHSPSSNELISKTKTVLPSLQRLGSGTLDMSQAIEGVESEQVLQLRDWYTKAKLKHEEHRRVDSTTRNEKASRLYYALHTLLYTSICATKTESLEKYVRSKATTLAKSVFSLEEWEVALKMAQEIRVQESKEILNLKMELNAQRNEVGASLSQASNILHSFGQEMTTLKSTVLAETSQFQQMYQHSQKQIAQVISQFTTKQDEMLNKLRLNAMSHHHDMRNEKQQREELGQQCEQLMKERDDWHERWKQMTVEGELATQLNTEVNETASLKSQLADAVRLNSQNQSRIEEFERQKEAFTLQIENLTANNLLLGQQMVRIIPTLS